MGERHVWEFFMLQKIGLFAILFFLAGCSSVYQDAKRCIKNEDYSTAKKQLERSGGLDAEGWALLAECNYHLEDVPGFLRACQASLQISPQFEPRITYLQEHAGIELLNRGIAAFQNQDYQEAARLFDMELLVLEALSPRANPALKSLRYPVLLFDAASYQKLKNYSQARSCCERARVIRPDEPEVLERLALACYFQGDQAACLSACEDLLKIHPTNGNALKWRAQILDNQGQAEKALNAYQDALDTFGGDLNLQQNLGLILFQLRDYTQARGYLENVNRSKPDSTGELAILIGECLYHEGKYQPALERFQYAAAARPHDADLKRYIGVCLWNLDRRHEAQTAFQQVGGALESVPDDTTTVQPDSSAVNPVDETKGSP
jgi:tetratricopeptide (TPR) repeat protein